MRRTCFVAKASHPDFASGSNYSSIEISTVKYLVASRFVRNAVHFSLRWQHLMTVLTRWQAPIAPLAARSPSRAGWLCHTSWCRFFRPNYWHGLSDCCRTDRIAPQTSSHPIPMLSIPTTKPDWSLPCRCSSFVPSHCSSNFPYLPQGRGYDLSKPNVSCSQIISFAFPQRVGRCAYHPIQIVVASLPKAVSRSPILTAPIEHTRPVRHNRLE